MADAKTYNFEEKYEHGGKRVTIPRPSIDLAKIDAFQFLELTDKLEEPVHINEKGHVVCIVLNGWAEVQYGDQHFMLQKYQAIRFPPGIPHRIIKGKGLLGSFTEEDYDKTLGTSWDKS